MGVFVPAACVTALRDKGWLDGHDITQAGRDAVGRPFPTVGASDGRRTVRVRAWKVPAVRYDAFGRHDTTDCFEGRPECRWPYVERLPADCAQCGTPLTKPQARFCSKACHDRSRYRERVPDLHLRRRV